jgi:hypothetical protein
MRRRHFLAATAAAAAVPLLGAMPAPAAVAGQVRDEFIHAWRGYRRFAWGFDEVRTVSGAGSNFFIPAHSFGLSIIEALDTLYVMELDDDLRDCVEWLRSHIDWDVDGDVQMFEAVIRMVAGLIAGYYATKERFMLDAARDLADRLLVCFTKSPSGAPYRFANLKTGAASDPKSNLAEIGSNILEFGDLSRLLGDPKYRNASMRAFETVMAKKSDLNLLGTNFDVELGDFSDPDDVAPDEPVDSFYEYLWGGWQMLGNAQTLDWYRLLTDAILKYKVVHIEGRLWFRQVNYRTGQPSGNTEVTELSSFYAELVSKGGNLDLGSAFYDSWTAVLDKFGLPPVVIDYATLSAVNGGYGMQPEYANSAFDLWFLTHDEKYRATAYRYFAALRANCRVDNGYTNLKDVRTTPMTLGDHLPAYALSENFKYLYLMFADDTKRFDGASYYLNTEGKVLRGLR